MSIEENIDENELPRNQLHPVDEFLHTILFSFVLDGGDRITYDNLRHLFGVIASYYPGNKEKLRQAKPQKILVICDQNQGRSQIAEFLVQSFGDVLGMNLKVKSAGQHATLDKYGGRPSPVVRKNLTKLGIPIENATVDQLQESDIDNETIVIILKSSSDLPEFIYNARLVIGEYLADPFPESKIPKTNDERLFELFDSITYFTVSFVLKLAKAIEAKDNNLNDFKKYFASKIIRKN